METRSENKKVVVKIEQVAKDLYTREVEIDDGFFSMKVFDDIITEHQLLDWLQKHPVS